MQLLDLGAHLDAELGIEVRQRLVEQEHLRVAHDRASHGDAPPLAAGELARIPVEIRCEPQDPGGSRDTLLDVRAAAFRELQRANDMLSRTVMCG